MLESSKSKSNAYNIDMVLLSFESTAFASKAAYELERT